MSLVCAGIFLFLDVGAYVIEFIFTTEAFLTARLASGVGNGTGGGGGSLAAGTTGDGASATSMMKSKYSASLARSGE
jgi:hypothetical protein